MQTLNMKCVYKKVVNAKERTSKKNVRRFYIFKKQVVWLEHYHWNIL